jgi:hypothetical protein
MCDPCDFLFKLSDARGFPESFTRHGLAISTGHAKPSLSEVISGVLSSESLLSTLPRSRLPLRR